MSLTPTTPAAIIEAIAGRIASITPSYQPNHHFRIVDTPDIGGSAETRVVFVWGTPETIDPESPFGSGEIGFVFGLKVRIAYGGETQEAAPRFAGSDLADIWEHPTKGIKHAPGQVTGLYSPYSGQGFYTPSLEALNTDRGGAVYELTFPLHFLRIRNSG